MRDRKEGGGGGVQMSFYNSNASNLRFTVLVSSILQLERVIRSSDSRCSPPLVFPPLWMITKHINSRKETCKSESGD